MSRKSKKYNEAAKLVDRTKLYDVEEAMELLEKTHHVNFDVLRQDSFRSFRF